MYDNQNRQIHLDFHTSGLIADIAKDFDPQVFAKTLKDASVAKVCLFTRCHHGYCYYPTQVGTKHPNLQVDNLLGEQIKALDSAGIEHSLYTTICWDELSAENHPDWIAINYDNQVQKMNPLTGEQMNFNEPGWRTLCWNTGYREHFKNLVQEALELFQTKSFFIDILMTPAPCVCPSCIKRMRKQGLNPNEAADRLKNSVDSAREFMDEVNEVIHKTQDGVLPFYNARLRVTGKVDEGSTPEIPQQGEICIESLPSGPWGYDHFPINAKHFQNFDKPIYGMTGKFQKMWGDFGGLKNQAALDFEVLRMLSHGLAVNVGDQLHPRGVLDKATYELIGRSYKKMLPFESDFIPSKPVDEIAVLLTNSSSGANNFGDGLAAETGAMKMLSQKHYQFSFIDETFSFEKYKLLILPDRVSITETLAGKLKSYLKAGGKIIASYESGLNKDNDWSLPEMDLEILDEHDSKPYYVKPGKVLLETGRIEETDHVFYLGGKRINSKKNEVLAKIVSSYFNREWDHYCSHLQTPPNPESSASNTAEMIFNGKNIIYFASPIFTNYEKFASKSNRAMVEYGLKTLLNEEKLIQSTLPTTAEVCVRKNKADQTLLSILHYVPQRRGDGIDIIEDVIPLVDQSISIRLSEKPKRIVDISTGNDLTFEYQNGQARFHLDKINGYSFLRFE